MARCWPKLTGLYSTVSIGLKIRHNSFYTRWCSSTQDDSGLSITLLLITFSICFSLVRVPVLSELLFSMSRKADFDIDSTTTGDKKNWRHIYLSEDIKKTLTINHLQKWCLNLNNNTLYILSLSVSRQIKGLFTWIRVLGCIVLLIYHLVSTCPVIGQFSRLYSTVWPAKFKSLF